MNEVEFVRDGSWWRADVGDGVVGPAGTDLLELNGFALEFDRTELPGLLGILVDVDADADPDSVWLRDIVPDVDRLLATVDDRVSSVTVELPDELLAVAALVARLDGELGEVDGSGPEVLAFEAVVRLELTILLDRLDRWLPGLSDPAATLGRAVQCASAEDGAVWDLLLAPGTAEREIFEHLVDGVELIAAEAAAPFRAALAGPADVAVPLRPLEEQVLAPARAPGAPPPPRVVLPRTEVRGERFTTAVDLAVLGGRAEGLVRDSQVDGRPAYRVELRGVHRRDSTPGPLWIRLFSGEEVVAGGPAELDVAAEVATAVLPYRVLAPEVTHAEVWVNPYRFPDEGSLATTPQLRALATTALTLSRVALRRDRGRRAWQAAAEAWLAAGYLDRAALALAQADSPEAWVWARSDPVRARIARRTAELPDAMRWHPDFDGAA